MSHRQLLKQKLTARLDAQKQQGRYRNPPRITARSGRYATIKGKPLLNFASNDYLGLASCPQWQQAVSRCFAKHAPSTSSSRLVTGNLARIDEYEQAFAEHFGYDECLFFPSGYQANLAVLSGLLHEGDTVFYDKRIHASMAHALPQTNANLAGFTHNNLDQLKRKLERKLHNKIAQSTQRDTGNTLVHSSPLVQPVILAESLYSMDGDIPDMTRLGAIKEEYDAFCIIDEAHAIGPLGEQGNGIAGGIADITVGTLGKALGLFGAFVLMPHGFKEFLSNFASPVIYSTAMPEPFAACALSAMQRVKSMDKERDQLAKVSAIAKAALKHEGFIVHGDAHILAVEIGDEGKAVQLATELQQEGILVFAARYPTVPQNRAVIRISITALHSANDVETLVTGIRVRVGGK